MSTDSSPGRAETPKFSRSCEPPDADGGAGGSRRTFLRKSATAALAVPALVAAASSSAQAAKPRTVVRLVPGLLGGLRATSPAVLFDEILSDEATHVTILQKLLDDKDNHLTPKIRPMPRLRNLVQPTFAAFVEAAAGFENTGSGTYGGALFAIQQTKEYFPIAVGLTTVEARHASWLNSLLGDPLVPSFVPVESPIEQEITLARVAPFIADLRAPMPAFDPNNASSDNNFAILDFLLLLEYIEAAFYMVNVAKFIG